MRGAAAPIASEVWHRQAACRASGVDPDLFYGRDPENPNAARKRVRAAKRVCGRCPVRELCLADALARREPFGVWGGLSERERQELLAGRQPRRPRRGRAA